MPSLNPFHPIRIRDTSNYTFLQRIEQVYRFFAGNPNASSSYDTHFGIIDFLTLGILALTEFIFLRLSDRLDRAADRDEHAFGCILGLLLFLTSIICGPLKLASMIFGAAAVLITSPITFFVHLALSFGGSSRARLRNNQMSYQNIDYQYNDNFSDNHINDSFSLLHEGVNKNNKLNPPNDRNYEGSDNFRLHSKKIPREKSNTTRIRTNNSTIQQFNNSTIQQFNNSTIQQFNNSWI